MSRFVHEGEPAAPRRRTAAILLLLPVLLLGLRVLMHPPAADHARATPGAVRGAGLAERG